MELNLCCEDLIWQCDWDDIHGVHGNDIGDSAEGVVMEQFICC
jgi:hypothetical protein